MKLIQDKRCDICGRAYRGAFNSKRCPDCQAVYTRAYCRFRNAAKARGEAVDNIAAQKYADKAAREEVMPATEGRRCLYCGKKLKGDKSAYCVSCLTNGLANVHEVTGRTNGWERRRGNPAEIKPGWRGQMVMGGGSSRRGPNA